MAGIIHRLGIFIAALIVIVATWLQAISLWTDQTTNAAEFFAFCLAAFSVWVLFRGLAWVILPKIFGLKRKPTDRNLP
jgi:uncharacterized protein with PQ loop repeat